VFAVAEASRPVKRELDRFGLTAKIGDDRFYDSLDAARQAFHASGLATGDESR
jgi:hypothetical protein